MKKRRMVNVEFSDSNGQAGGSWTDEPIEAIRAEIEARLTIVAPGVSIVRIWEEWI